MGFVFTEPSPENSQEQNTSDLLTAHEVIANYLLKDKNLETQDADRVSEVQDLVVKEYLPKFKLLRPAEYSAAWEKAKQSRKSLETGAWEGLNVSQQAFFILDEVAKILKDKD